jgi:hypothetical protein
MDFLMEIFWCKIDLLQKWFFCKNMLLWKKCFMKKIFMRKKIGKFFLWKWQCSNLLGTVSRYYNFEKRGFRIFTIFYNSGPRVLFIHLLIPTFTHFHVTPHHAAPRHATSRHVTPESNPKITSFCQLWTLLHHVTPRHVTPRWRLRI